MNGTSVTSCSCNSHQIITSRYISPAPLLFSCSGMGGFCPWPRTTLPGCKFGWMDPILLLFCSFFEQSLDQRIWWILCKDCHAARTRNRRIKQVSFRKACNRFTYQEISWSNISAVIWMIGQSCQRARIQKCIWVRRVLTSSKVNAVTPARLFKWNHTEHTSLPNPPEWGECGGIKCLVNASEF